MGGVMALIPARGGSKRLPGKNLRPLAGKPMIAHTIEAARAAACIDQVVVSTDCPQIAQVARQYGAEVPGLRPAKLASDEAGSAEVVAHALSHWATPGISHVALLQPTSPLRGAEHIDAAWEQMQRHQARAVVSVTPCEHPPQWSNQLGPDASLDGFLSRNAQQRSQDLGPWFRLNGAIYLFERTLPLSSLYGPGSHALVMDNRASVDIDTLLDFQFAEFLLTQTTPTLSALTEAVDC
ncbi:acylneuraminate cytidylyltransferase family protein [Ferrimonas marina]|uniref:N-acylneuraminate cytidylyltransferase n=1 Tax=Ferrimonas marina TaxID=299255 RepID=A0A1M5QU54_9GAMM|nr:acylneuraminate cytidylyltransferase family protein [Ferrimonas marina]SHH17612.1 N-acylneuraminate cytidylyltransferase [Ferrimonas marina]